MHTNLWCIHKWQRVNVLQVILDTFSFRDHVALVEAELVSEHIFAEPDPGKSVQEVFVQVIRDPASVLDFPEHVAQADPIHPAFGVNLIQVVLHKLHAGRKVRLVKLIWDVPTQGSKLTPLL